MAVIGANLGFWKNKSPKDLEIGRALLAVCFGWGLISFRKRQWPI
jgi:hypothetical protein